MFNQSRVHKILLALSTFTLVFASGTGVADDTEIYFSSGSSSGNTDSPLIPNVLFILDTSGSMAWDAPGTGKSRIQVLKEAMNEIIGSVEDINLGLMRFTGSEGGPVIFPITYIDSPSGDTLGEPSDDPAFSYRITDGNDDGEENNDTDAVTLTDPTLDIGETVTYTPGTASVEYRTTFNHHDAEEDDDGNMNLSGTILDVEDDNLVGVRFYGVDVPADANITSAYLDFWVHTARSGSLDIDVRAQKVDSASIIDDDDDDLSDRDYYDGSQDIEWDSVPNSSAGSMVTSPNLEDMVQRIVDRSGWNEGQNMLFLLIQDSGSGTRDWISFDTSAGSGGNSTTRPRLRINYETTVSSTGANQTIALRFQNVNIPQGAALTEASLVFTPQLNDSSSANWTFRAEASDNSAALAATAANISGRATTTNSVSWSVPAFTANTAVETTFDLKPLIEEVTDRAGWCGGNDLTIIITGTGTRKIKAVEQSASEAPELKLAYDASGPIGCFQDTDSAQAGTTNDDAEETVSNGDMSRDGSTLNLQSGNIVAARFRDLKIPQGADILSANVKFISNNSDSGTTTVTITGHDVDNASAFTSTDEDISDRPRTTASVTWSETDSWSSNNAYYTDDLSTIIQEIVDRGGWESDNDIVLIFETTTATDRRAHSYDSDANKGPVLTVTYESSGGDTSNVKTVRERLIELVNDLPADGSTPIVETMYEAAHYWRGEAVKYGLERDGSSKDRISHPGSYCTEESGVLDCRGADVANYPPYGVDNPSGCDPDVNPNDSDCVNQDIEGSPDYVSPFSSELSCAKNYQVLLTDGAANSTDDSAKTAIRNEFLDGDACLVTNSAGNSYISGEVCGVDIAKFLFENDQVDDAVLNNDQTVTTYTIAFNLTDSGAVQFLTDMAHEGTGGTDDGFYSATNAADLVSVFNTILTDVKKDPTSFVAPSLATNAFNRLLSRDEVYFGLFTPSLERNWYGNVKKYNICTVSTGDDPSDNTDDCTLGEILDASGDAAVDSVSNRFLTTAQSVWSDVVDGQATTRGGSGGEIVDYTLRTLYTDATSSGTAPTSGTVLSADPHLLNLTTWDDLTLAHIRTAVCPTPSVTAGSDCANRINWLFGKIITPDSDNDASATTRWAHNDVLHSSPVVVTYGGNDGDSDGVIDTFFDKIVVGTNEGGLRMINGTTGAEDWMFLPRSRLALQQQLFDNAEADHPYGMDVTPTLQFRDTDNDGRIEPAGGDFVRVFSSMRRGGDFIYALDITGTSQITNTTATVVPKFMWRIEGGTGDFTRLGETWSQPRLAKIYVDVAGVLTQKEVLIFGGGYDGGLDDIFGFIADDGNDNSDPNHMGNAIYIVDAETGARVMSISGDGSGADVEVEAMHYPIASRVTVLDSDGDGIDDRLYVGDLGGQVWRVDLAPDVKVTGTGRAGSSVVGQLAKISAAGGTNERRFFEPPSVVQVKDTVFSDAAGGEYDYVLMGTGWRQHPLDKDADDRFYAFRDEVIGTMTDSNDDNLAESYPADTSGNAPITNTDLIDITDRILDADDSDLATIKASKGWFYDFTDSGNDGEKVLSAPITIAGAVFVTTYLPDAIVNTDACSANIGGGNAYNFNILSSAATIDWDLDGVVDELADRTLELGGGIPSDVVPVFTSEGIVGIVGIEGGAAQLGTLSGLPRFRTYWYEESGL